MTISKFKTTSLNDHYFLLASHLPPGEGFEKSFDSNDDLGKLFKAMAIEHRRFQFSTENLLDELDINQTDKLINEWEKSVGIPNSCFSTNESKAKRQLQILQVYTKFGGVQIASDFKRVALVFGIDVNVETGVSEASFPLKFPIGFLDSKKTATHTIFIEIIPLQQTGPIFPLPFPLPFNTNDKAFLQCIFDKLAPANVKVIIIYEGDL